MGNFIKSLTKKGKEGFTDIPDITVTDTDHLSLRAIDLEMKSGKEIVLLREMRKVEGIFPPVERHNQWTQILFFLKLRGINLNLFNWYDYKGFRLSIIRYLEMRGADEKDGHLVECSRSVRLALDMWAAKHASNIDELYRLAQQGLFRGYKLGVSIHDEAIVVNAEVIDGGKKGNEVNRLARNELVEAWVKKAQELGDAKWDINPGLSRERVAALIRPKLVEFFEKQGNFVNVPKIKQIRLKIINPYKRKS